jgi:hypothetical protein
MIQLLRSILWQTKNILALSIGSVLLFVILRILPQFHIIRDFWKLSTVDVVRKFEVFYNYSLGSYSTWYFFETSLTILLTIATVLNIIIFIRYFKRQKKVLNKGSLLTTSAGLFLGMLGVGCISCGAIILAPLLSVLGLLGALEILPFAGRELVVIGLLFIIGSSYYLLRQLNQPLLCK